MKREAADARRYERWVFKLEKDFRWKSGTTFSDDLAFLDKKGKVRLVLRRDGEITVTSGYSWDGCSPKFCVLDVLVGTPDGAVDSRTKKPKTYYASLVHDTCYQFLDDGLPIERHQADRFFLELMKETGFAPQAVYWAAVYALGGIYRWLTKRDRKPEGRRVPLSEIPFEGQSWHPEFPNPAR